MKLDITDIAGSAASRRHNPGIFHFGKSEIADHYLAVFIRAVVKKILRLKTKKINKLAKLMRLYKDRKKIPNHNFLKHIFFSQSLNTHF